VRAGRIREAERILRASLPAWPTSPLVIRSASELLKLKASAAVARRAGVPRAWTTQFEHEADRAMQALWRSADRLSAVKDEHVTYEALAPRLAQDEEKLRAVIEAAEKARTGLAELTMWGERVGERPDLDLQGAEAGLRALGSAARDL
jgi:hypothetical protein